MRRFCSRVPDGDNDIRYGVLLGSVKQSCGYTYVFINGAVDVREIFDNTVLFGDDIWTGLNDDISRYFSGLKVTGWFLSQNGSNANQNMWIKKMHLNNFAGTDKVFYKIDREEGEEAFYCYGREQLERMGCYHIYYEKNPEMIRYVEETGADMHFKRLAYGEARTGAISRAAERRAEKIKNNINGKNLPEENENTENLENPQNIENTENKGQKTIKYFNGRNMKKAASFLIICGLAGTLGFMGMNGQLDNLAEGFNNIVDDIIHNNDEPAGGTGIISVNGVPSDNNKNEMNTGENEETTAEPESDSGNNADNSAEANGGNNGGNSNEANSNQVGSENNSENQNGSGEANGQEQTTAENVNANQNAPAENQSGNQTNQTNEENTTSAEENNPTASVLPASTRSYPVEKGDTLYSICMKLYGSTANMEIIIELNNLESADDIYYGKNLIVP